MTTINNSITTQKLELPVVVLAGGLGTRLRSSVPDAPKALAPIAGAPFVTYLLRQLRSFELNKVIFSTGYRAEQLEAACGSAFDGMAISYSKESEPLGTGGAIRLALTGVPGELFLILNGDSYCDFKLSEFIESHRTRESNLSVLLTKQDDTSRYGRVESNSDGKITAFAEKSAGQGPGWINAGVYLLSKAVVDSIPKSGAVSLEREIFPRWIGKSMFGYKNDSGTFIDIGTPESFQLAQSFFGSE